MAENRFWDRVRNCDHTIGDEFYESHSCTCGGAHTWRCVSCRAYITEDPCGERSGVSGWPPSRWRDQHNKQDGKDATT